MSKGYRVPRSQGLRIPRSTGGVWYGHLKVTFEYELDSKEGLSCSCFICMITLLLARAYNCL